MSEEEWFRFGEPGQYDVHGTGGNITAEMLEPGPPPNLVFRLGEPPSHMSIGILEKRTLVNRLRWWALCRVFPFTVEKWEEMK